MNKVVLYMSMSVDGFIAGPDDSEEHGLGVGGELLHGWLADGGVGPGVLPAADEAGATVFDEVHGHRGGHHRAADVRVRGRLGGRPPRRRPDLRADRPPPEPPPGSALLRHRHRVLRRRGQGRRRRPRLLLHGAATAQECLRAGLLDEMQLHLVPVLLGQGRRLFADLPPTRRARTRPRAGRARRAAPALPVGGGLTWRSGWT